MKILNLLFFNLLACYAIAQNNPIDGVYERNLHQDKRILEYDFMHEGNLGWEKRIWRVIDLKQKQNEIFKNEKEPLISILLDGLLDSTIQAYSPINDEFKEKMTWEELYAWGAEIEEDHWAEFFCFREWIEAYQKKLTEPTCWLDEKNFISIEQKKSIKKYRLKEAWFFDEETGIANVRILGIAPIISRYDDNGNFLNESPLCWLYYPDIRAFLAKQEVFNLANDGVRLTWEDVFEARLFGSYIIKESNNSNQRIQDYKTGTNALLEGENINSKLRNIEGDLFQY